MKTLPLYLLVVGVWILTMFIPGRYLILILGLSEFVYEFTTKPEVLPMKSRYKLCSIAKAASVTLLSSSFAGFIISWRPFQMMMI